MIMNSYIKNDKSTSYINKHLVITAIIVVAISAIFHVEAASNAFGDKVVNGTIFWITSAIGSTVAILVGFTILKRILDKMETQYNFHK
jgi:hypothetical protein